MSFAKNDLPRIMLKTLCESGSRYAIGHGLARMSRWNMRRHSGWLWLIDLYKKVRLASGEIPISNDVNDCYALQVRNLILHHS